MDDANKTKDELVQKIRELEVKLRRMQDTDERRAAAEGRLKESEKQLKALTGNIPLGLYRRTCGPDGKLVMVNPALVRMFRYDSEEELNQVPVVNLYYHPEQCVDFSNKLFTNGEVIREELKMRRKDGERL